MALHRRDTLPPGVLQIVGLAGIVMLGIFWAVSGRLDPTLLAAAGSLVGIGQYVTAHRGLTDDGDSASSTPDKKSHDAR